MDHTDAGLRFVSNQSSSRPLLDADVDYNENVDAWHEEGESYEVEDITNHPKESSMNWQGKLDDSDDYNSI